MMGNTLDSWGTFGTFTRFPNPEFTKVELIWQPATVDIYQFLATIYQF
jgi:hypothetical protein